MFVSAKSKALCVVGIWPNKKKKKVSPHRNYLSMYCAFLEYWVTMANGKGLRLEQNLWRSSNNPCLKFILFICLFYNALWPLYGYKCFITKVDRQHTLVFGPDTLFLYSEYVYSTTSQTCQCPLLLSAVPPGGHSTGTMKIDSKFLN